MLRRFRKPPKPKRPPPNPGFTPQDYIYGLVCAGLLLIVVVFGALAWHDAESGYGRPQSAAVSRCGSDLFNGRQGQEVFGAAGQINYYPATNYRLDSDEGLTWALVRSGSDGTMLWCRVVAGLAREDLSLESSAGGSIITATTRYGPCALALTIRAEDGRLEAVRDTPAGTTTSALDCSTNAISSYGLDPTMLNPEAAIGTIADH